MIFKYFFSDYIAILKRERKKTPFFAWLFLSIAVLLILAMFYFVFLQKLIPLFITILFLFIVVFATSIYDKKTLLKYPLETYKADKIDKLLKLLKSEKYNFYNQAGIDYLISCCKENLTFPLVNTIAAAVGTYVLILAPIGTALFEFFTNHYSNNTDIVFGFATQTVVIITLIYIVWIFVKPSLVSLIYGNSSKYKNLLSDLEYIKTQLPKDN